MKKIKFLFFILFFLARAHGANADEFINGRIQLNEKDQAGKQVKIQIQTIPYPDEYLYKTGFWGTNIRSPEFLISKFNIWWSNKEIYLPLSAFVDLVNPSSVSFKNIDKEFYVVEVRGGQTATLYTAILTFKNDLLIKRKVFLHEFEHERWEETTYSWILDNGR